MLLLNVATTWKWQHNQLNVYERIFDINADLTDEESLTSMKRLPLKERKIAQKAAGNHLLRHPSLPANPRQRRFVTEGPCDTTSW